MADPEKVLKPGDEGYVAPGEGTVVVKQADLTEIMTKLGALEKANVDKDAQMAGLEAMLEESKGADVAASGKLRERKSFEPKFRTVRLRKYPMAGDFSKQGFVVGWTNRGAYQEVDRSGVTPQNVDMIEVIFLGHEKNPETGKLQAEKIKLLDLLNKGEQVHCKVLSVERKDRKEPTGEEIDVTVWDPAHGLMATGDKIDGWVGYSDITYTVEIPGVGTAVIDGLYVN